MDRDRHPSAPRKKRFAPKPPPGKRLRPVPSKTDGDDGKDKEEHQTSGVPNVDKKSSGHGDSSSTKVYKEPWDYEHSDPPVTLPLRKPNSGDPQILDQAEQEAPPYDENAISAASALGLLPENKDDPPGLFFFQFPTSLPRRKSDVSSKGKEIAGSSSSAKSKGCGLEDLPEGYMGKMLVYKSGAVKLKLGDVLLDVSAGCDVNCPEQVMAINKKKGHLCHVGDVSKKAVVSVEFDDSFFNHE